MDSKQHRQEGNSKYDIEKINLLLDKYWACLSSVEEEEILRNYFQQEDIPDTLKDTAALFRFYAAQSEQALNSEEFDNRMLHQLGTAEEGILQKPRQKVLSLFRYYGRAAVLIVGVLVSAYFVKNEYERSRIQTALVEDTFEDPQKAFEETKKALMLISSKFNKGKAEVEKMAVFHTVEKKVKNIK